MSKKSEKLETVEAVKRELETVYFNLKSGKIDAKTANGLVYALNIIRGLFSDVLFEQKIIKIEQELKNEKRAN